MSTCLIGSPIYSDAGVTYSGSYSGGSWSGALPLANVADRRLSLVARSSNAALASTRLHLDLGTSRSIGVVAIPKHTLSTASKVRILGQTSTLLFDYEAGDDVTVRGGTFARADATSCATYFDRGGTMRTVATGVLRDAHFIGGVRTTLLEPATTNLLLRSNALDNAYYTKTRCSITANTDTAPDGTLTADRIVEDSTAANTHFVNHTAVTVTANANVAFSWWFKPGPRTWVALRLTDSTGTDWGQQYFNLSTGATGTSSTAGTGTVVLAYTQLGTGTYAGWVRCVLVVNIGNSRTSAQGLVLLATGNGTSSYDGDGASYVTAWGGMVEDAKNFATSYVASDASPVTRAVDVLYFSLPSGMSAPVALTADMKFVELGTLLTTSAHALHIGASNSSAYMFDVAESNGKYLAFLRPSSGVGTLGQAAAAAAPSFGDTVELRVPFTTTIALGQSINSAAEALATSGSYTFPTQWAASSSIFVGCLSTAGANAASMALQYLRIMAGASNSLATMQGAVYDSGWLNGWPSNVAAEDVNGLNVAFVHVPSSNQTARYWSLQIDDSDNSAGYVDLARVLFCGGYLPTANMVTPAVLGLEADTQRMVTDGGAAVYQPKPIRRSVQFALDQVDEAEAFANLWKIQRLSGLDTQLFWVWDTADTTLQYERCFLGVIRKLGGLEAPYVVSRYKSAWEIVEEL